eukprot:TRINITY_DN59247_c0_g1_i1.p1 TRINITY_DN59247_c0_g1~~TRINITY_DN59247_c0_g1_i1.p1  ORF type:complete len:391 (-),score=58.69 TRINITY_DN59247_c0_g1_i1:32-1204(-)
MAKSDDVDAFKSFLSSIGVRNGDLVASALRKLTINAQDDLKVIDKELVVELDAELRSAGVSLGDRGRIKAFCQKTSTSTTEVIRPAHLDEPLPLDNVLLLRKALAAIGAPDEGMRGTPADALKMQAASDQQVLAVLSKALRARSAEASAAAAIVRSISITPSAAASVCSVLAAPLCAALSRPAPVLTSALLALSCISQYSEAHGMLLAADAVAALSAHARSAAHARNTSTRLDLVACVSLALLAGTAGSSAALQVPLRAGPALVDMLHRRLFVGGGPGLAAAENAVKKRIFCGLPIDYSPCSILKALAQLVEKSGAHAGTLWKTVLPELLRGTLDGDLLPDWKSALPNEEPHFLEMATVCAKVLLERSEGQDPLVAQALRTAFTRVRSSL